jgi:hypothetical protein
MASVAKWLRQRIVVPPFVGSSPIVRPRVKQINTATSKSKTPQLSLVLRASRL